MKLRFARYVIHLLRAGIVLCLLWSLFMLVVFWRSGVEETQQAFATGKRFIVYVADGKVEGAVTSTDVEEKAEMAVPPPSAPLPEEEGEVPPVHASSNPIAAVSEDLLDKKNATSLPKISATSVQPWQYYGKIFRRQNQFPLVAIIITGIGHSKHEMELAFTLDDRVGLSFSPYARSIASWTTASRLTGHEMYVDLPLQTAGYPNDDPGPYSILVTRSNTENLKNLMWAMSRFQGYVGMVAPLGEVVTHSADSFNILREEMAHRGVMFLNAREPAMKDNEKQDKRRLTEMNTDVWIDEELSEMAIQARLATLEQIAQRNGFAIGVARSYPLSMLQIKSWSEGLASRSIVLAPPSYVTKLKYP